VDFFAFDKHYVDRLRHGDPATERHFAGYFGKFLRMRLRATRLAPDEIDDIVRQTLLSVMNSVHQGGVRQPECFGSFVNSICSSLLPEHYRLSGRGQSHEEPKDRIEQPGSTLCAIAGFLCSKRTVEEIIIPLIADMQFEYDEALVVGCKRKAQWVHAKGWWSFLMALGFKFIVGAYAKIFLRASKR
jgi:hypothetical protein